MMRYLLGIGLLLVIANQALAERLTNRQARMIATKLADMKVGSTLQTDGLEGKVDSRHESLRRDTMTMRIISRISVTSPIPGGKVERVFLGKKEGRDPFGLDQRESTMKWRTGLTANASSSGVVYSTRLPNGELKMKQSRDPKTGRLSALKPFGLDLRNDTQYRLRPQGGGVITFWTAHPRAGDRIIGESFERRSSLVERELRPRTANRLQSWAHKQYLHHKK